MHLEVTAAINLIASSLYNKLPRRRVDSFCEEVEKGIFIKIQGNWHLDNPSKGAAYRCIHVSGEKVDPIFIYAAINSGLDMEEVSSYLTKDFVIWINPGEVTFTMGDKSQVKVLYAVGKTAVSTGTASVVEETTVAASLPQQPPISLSSCPTAITSGSSAMSSPLSSPDELASTLSSSFGSLSLSSGGSNGTTTSWGAAPSPIPWPATSTNAGDPWSPMSTHKTASFPWNSESTFNAISGQPAAFQMGSAPISSVPSVPSVPSAPRPTNSNKTMTAAMFAQTKFGSTKLKSHTKRSSRLSPTENFNRTMQGPGSMYSNGPARQTPTMNPAFLDRMQTHMNNNQCDFPIDHFKMATASSMNRTMAPTRTAMASSANNPVSTSNGPMGRYSPCAINSPLAAMFSSDQDWIDLSDMTLPSSVNPLLAA